MFCLNHASTFYTSNNIDKNFNNKFEAQTLTGNPTGNALASRAINMSCTLLLTPYGKIPATLTDNIFTWNFVNENGRFPIQISLKFVPKCSIDSQHWLRWWLGAEKTMQYYRNCHKQFSFADEFASCHRNHPSCCQHDLYVTFKLALQISTSSLILCHTHCLLTTIIQNYFLYRWQHRVVKVFNHSNPWKFAILCKSY